MALELQVNLAERSYPIAFAGEVVGPVKETVERLMAARRKIAILTDTNVARVQEPVLRQMFGDAPVHQVPAGEGAKSLTEYGGVLDFLAANKLDRGGVLFAVGGGVIGDLGGFAAASWLRGIDFYQVPTTLLAMVDSSVGGKTGINLKAGKNLVGAFHQPRGVFISTEMLTTLPAREFAAGMAEVIKYALLGDVGLLADLESSALKVGDPRLPRVIHRCCEMKAGIVEADERELAREGGRALLNLGHTFGHAIEQVTGYGAYLHGEAVGIGLCAAARLSQKLGYLSAGDVARMDRVVAVHALPIQLKTPLSLQELLAAMARDKKVRSGLPRFVVLTALGRAVTQENVDPRLVEAAFREVGAKG